MEEKSPPHSMWSSPPRDHLQMYTKDSIAELALFLSTNAPIDANNYHHFVLALFSQMTKSVWYNIIPFDQNDTSGMSTSMGQRWELVIPLFLIQNTLF